MSTGSKPNPPEQPTGQAPAQATQAPFDLASDIAGIIEAQADVIAQRLAYHSQVLFGVSAQGVDVVNGRNSTLIVANALRNDAEKQAISTLVNLGTSQTPQINDATLPYHNNSLAAGLLEGLLLDVVAQAYRNNLDRTKEARLLLDGYFQAANKRLENPTRALESLAPQSSQSFIPDPNAHS